MAFGRGSTTTKDVNFSDLNDEYAVFSWWKPYIMMASGAAITFFSAALIRIFMWISFTYADKNPQDMANLWTMGILVFGTIATFMIYKFYNRRAEQGNEVLIRFHPTMTSVLGIIWFVIAMQENVGSWMFGELSLFFGVFFAAFAMLTWSARRWSFKQFQTEQKVNEWESLGFGETSAMGNVPVPGGRKIKLKLDPKVTVEDMLDKITLIAKKFKTNIKKIRIQEDPEDPNYAFVTVMDEEPFAEAILWQGPHKPGASIAEGIEFATYDVGGRPELFLSGKNGGSTNHWLTVGMTGSGKTFGWQVIHASTLNRKEVSLIFIDPAKGLGSVMPLASGVEWFADGFEESVAVIEGVERAIKSRQNYLQSQGLTYWKPGCGINFLIFHVEEAADFMDKTQKDSREALVRIARVARSAGIAVIYSLQRPTADNLPTSLRANLEGRVTFKVADKKEAGLGLNGAAAAAGALPQLFSAPGMFYLTGPGIDQSLAGNALRTDFMDEDDLQRAVDLGAANRTPLDSITAAAFGSEYENYRVAVANETTEWQRVRKAREARKNRMNEPTAEYETVNSEDVKYEEPVKSKRADNLKSDPAVEREKLWNFIVALGKDEFTKSEIYKPYSAITGLDKKSTVCTQIDKWVDADRLKEMGSGKYKIN